MFWTISSHAGSHIHIRQREKLEYFLLNFLQKRRLTPPLCRFTHVCCCRMSRIHREARKIWRQLRSLSSEFLFPANRTWNCANIVTSSNSCAMQYFSSYDLEVRSFVHRHQYFENNRFCGPSSESRIYRSIYFLYCIAEKSCSTTHNFSKL